jgi:O-methyltransferase
MDSSHRYLDLLKKALSYSLWDPPPVPLDRVRNKLSFWKRAGIGFLERLLALKNLRLVWALPYSAEDLALGRTFPELAHTMIGLRQLNQLQEAVETTLAEGIDGDLIEAGVWRGGACIFMRAVLLCHGIENRRVFVADSFDGFPPPDLKRYPADKQYVVDRGSGFARVPLDEVKANFEKYGLLDDRVVFVSGYFETSLANAGIERLSVLRIDADMYGSTWAALTQLYPLLSPGGFCIVDDYAAFECRGAVDEYRRSHDISEVIERIDHSGIYWRRGLNR